MTLRTMTVRRLVAANAFAALLATALAPAVQADDRYVFSIQNVKPGDWLNVRERIDNPKDIYASKVLGSLPPTASNIVGTGASQMIDKHRWYEISYKGIRGWVNGRYLKPGTGDLDTLNEVNVFCSGTEPFWSLKIVGKEATYAVPGESKMLFNVEAREPLKDQSAATAMRLSFGANQTLSLLVAQREWCSDGMSDVNFALDATLLRNDAAQSPLKGCCSMLR